MTDTVDKSIDEILRYFRGWVSLAGNSGEPMYKLGEYEQGELDEAKQAIKDLIEQEVVEARFEELRSLALEYSQCSIPERAVLDRLKVLKPQLKDKS